MALDVTDKTSNANVLTNTGSVAESASTPFAASSTSASFDGSNYLIIADASQTGLDITGNITIEGQFKITAWPGADAALIAKGDLTAGEIAYQVHILAAKRIHFQFQNGGSASAFQTDVLSDTLLNQWNHFAVATTVATPTCQIYIAGAAVTTNTVATNASSIGNNAQPLTVGAYSNGGGADRFYTGLLDEIRLWNTVRTGTQISNNYQIELVGNETGLVFYLPFESLTVAVHRTLTESEYFWFSTRSGEPANAPLSQHKYGYFASKGIPKAPITQMERVWLQGVASSTKINEGDLWREAVAKQGLTPSVITSENKFIFFTQVATNP